MQVRECLDWEGMLSVQGTHLNMCTGHQCVDLACRGLTVYTCSE